MSEELEKADLHVDDFNKIRIYKPSRIDYSEKLINNTDKLTTNVTEFLSQCEILVGNLSQVVNMIDAEKMMAISLRSRDGALLRSKKKEREELIAKIERSKKEEEVLRMKLNSLQLELNEQNSIINELLLNR